MKKNIEKIINIPEGIEVNVKDSVITIQKDGKELRRIFALPKIVIAKDKDLKISAENATKRELKMIGTIRGHIMNMIEGLQEDFVYKMEVCNVHFPMNVKVEGDKLVIKTFLGETVDRYAKILPNVNVEIVGNIITISSFDKESAGQTAANIEKATKLKGRDRRVFQDGIFITEKCGRKI